MEFKVRPIPYHQRSGVSSARVKVWTEHREHHGAPATFRHKKQTGESGFARVSRLQRDTRKCECGAPSVIYKRVNGREVYLCLDCAAPDGAVSEYAAIRMYLDWINKE